MAVSSNEQLPSQLNATFNNAASNTLVRMEPISSVKRVVEDHIGFTSYSTGTTLANETIVESINPLIGISSLSTHITPFTLADVTLFIAGPGSLNFDEQADDPVTRLAPRKVLQLLYGTMDDLYPETIRVLHRYVRTDILTP